MEESEYNTKLEELETNHRLAKQKLYIQFGLSKKIYTEGDIIKGTTDTILIDRITVNKGFSLPEPVYHGLILKKDLTPRKDRERGSIYGNARTELIKKNTNQSV